MQNFKLEPVTEISSIFISMGFFDFEQAFQYIRSLPLLSLHDATGNYRSVLDEQRGTNSSKHGVLAHLIESHGVEELHLMVGILLPEKSLLRELGMDIAQLETERVPVAYSFLRENGRRLSCMGHLAEISLLEKYLVREQRCEAQQMITWKPVILNNFLENGCKRNDQVHNIQLFREVNLNVLFQ